MFEKILKSLGLTKKSFSTMSAINILKSGGNRSDVDYYEGWVYACVNKIAKGFAQVEWQLYEQKAKEVVELEEHDILSLLNRFNPRFTRYDSLELMAIYYTLMGHAPLLMIFPENSKKPSELWVLPPQNLSILKRDDDGYPLSYRYTFGSKSQEIPASQILDIRNPDPSDPSKAFGVIKPVRPVADSDYFAKLWNKNILLNQAMPTGVVEVPNKLTLEEAKALRSMIEETYSGFDNARKIAILQSGAKMTPFSLSPTDMDFSGMRNMNRDEICAMFGVPKILLGLDSGYNRATAETAEMVFAKYTLQPMLTKIVEQINEFLTPLFGSNLWVDFDYLVPEDKDFELRQKEVGWNKWLTTNEIRREEGRPELIGGDVIYGSLVNVPQIGVGGTKSSKSKANAVVKMELKTPYNGVSYLKAKRISKSIKVRDWRLKKYGIDIAERFEKKMNEKSTVKKVLKLRVAGLKKKSERQINFTAEQKLDYWYATIEKKRKIDGQWKAKMMTLFDRQKEIILANLADQAPFKGIKLKASKQKLDELMFDEDEQVKTTISIIKPEYYNSLMAGAELASELIGEEPVSILSIPKCVAWLDFVSEKYAESIVETTKTDLYRIFQTAFDEGQSNFQVQQQIETYFGEISSYRAEMIARTESARSLTASQGYVWDAYGFKDVEWYAEPTACEKCQGLSMDKWTVEDAQQGTVEYSHPNCECRFLPLK